MDKTPIEPESTVCLIECSDPYCLGHRSDRWITANEVVNMTLFPTDQDIKTAISKNSQDKLPIHFIANRIDEILKYGVDSKNLEFLRPLFNLFRSTRSNEGI